MAEGTTKQDNGLAKLLENRVARYSTRQYDWDALKFQADFDPKYGRAQMRYVGTGGTGVSSDNNTVPAEHFTFYTMTGLKEFVQAGKVRPLAITAQRRHPDFPNVPTFDELGIKLPLRTWFGFHFQTGTPREIITRYNTEIRKAMAEQSFKDTVMKRQGVSANDGTPEQFDAYIRNQIKDVAELVKTLGIQPE